MKPVARHLICLALLACLNSQHLAAQFVDSTAAKALFSAPPREFSTGPLWVWNDMLTEQQIRDTLRDLAEQKVKQVWVHPRPGLMTPYLSKDWFRLWKVALDEAEKLDLNVWIYDENSYPSGFAGGFVPDAMPDSRGRGLVLRESKTAPKWSADLVALYRKTDAGFENISAQAKAGQAFPEGSYLAAIQVRSGNSPWHGDRCYVNLLSPGVTEKFLQLTFEPYRRELGAQFGKRVPGAFTDEPNIRPAGDFPWSEVLAAEFKRRWGYELLDHLPSLSQPVGDWQKVRHNYMQVLNEQFIQHWAVPYHDYCEKNRLEWTGHYWDHEWPNCMGVPDNMAMYAWHQRPSIDCLMNQYAENTHAQFGNVRMVKEVSSIANQLGRKRTLCEVYGAGGWDLRFEDMKRIGDWLEVLGVNTLNQHLSYVTIRGARKRDHPQSFSYHEPWWSAYHISAEYFARLSAALSQGEQISRILLVEPTTTAWMHQNDSKRLKEIGDTFFNLVMRFEAAQVEYDIGCEDVLARNGSVVSGGLRIGQREYSLVVLPQMTENLNASTLKFLKDFLKQGGTVVSCGPPPERVDGTVSTEPSALAKLAGWKQVAPEALPHSLTAPDFQLTRKTEGILFHHRRQLADGELLFLVNTSIDSPASGSITSSLRGVEKWDPYTGNIDVYPFSRTAQGLKADFKLPPSGSLLLFLSLKDMKPTGPKGDTLVVLAPQAPPVARRLEPNVLTLDYVDVTAGGETRKDIYFYQGNQFAWKKNGMERDPWDSAVQFKDELISKKFPPASGFEASYKFTLSNSIPENLALVIERPDLYTITCNGRPVACKSNDWWLDKAFGRLNLASSAQVGENIVTLKASPFTMFHELEPAYLLGDFSLQPTAKGFIVVPESVGAPGLRVASEGWNAQGYPFYAGGVSYREQFQLPQPSGSYAVHLPAWRGSVARVTVNGEPAGFIDAPPWECDVTRWLKPGSNDLEVTVIGTLKNTLGPHHGNPALGSAWPGSFQKAPESGPPAGTEYSTVAYGLFQPFVINQSKRN